MNIHVHVSCSFHADTYTYMYALADSNQSKTILQTNGSQVYRSLPITTAITLDLHQYTSSLLRIIMFPSLDTYSLSECIEKRI